MMLSTRFPSFSCHVDYILFPLSSNPRWGHLHHHHPQVGFQWPSLSFRSIDFTSIKALSTPTNLWSRFESWANILSNSMNACKALWWVFNDDTHWSNSYRLHLFNSCIYMPPLKFLARTPTSREHLDALSSLRRLFQPPPDKSTLASWIRSHLSNPSQCCRLIENFWTSTLLKWSAHLTTLLMACWAAPCSFFSKKISFISIKKKCHKATNCTIIECYIQKG